MPLLSSLLFPLEIFNEVFEKLERPKEHLNVMLVCKTFYNLNLKNLYRNVYWRNPGDLDPAVWSPERGDFKLVPNTVTVGPISTSIVDLHSRTVKQVQWDLYRDMGTRMTTFVNLKEVTLFEAIFPNPICVILPNLPNLRHFALKSCNFGALGNSVPVDGLTQDMYLYGVTLNISELTVWKCMREHGTQDSASPYMCMLASTSGPSLRVLRVDWTSLTASFFSQQYQLIQYQLPVNLEVLEIRLPKLSAWTGGNTLTSLLQPLSVFLLTCTKLKEFHVHGHLPAISLPPDSLSSLELYSGSMAAAIGLLKGAPVREMHLTDQCIELKVLLPFLVDLAAALPQLQCLDIHVKEWEMEIIYAVTQLMPNLSKLTIKYSQGALSEARSIYAWSRAGSDYAQDLLVGFGSQFLARMPKITSIRIVFVEHRNPPRSDLMDLWPHFQVVDLLVPPESPAPPQPRLLGPCDDADTDFVDYFIPWNRYCKKLREIQLVHDHIWRRGFDRAPWRRFPCDDFEDAMNTDTRPRNSLWDTLDDL